MKTKLLLISGLLFFATAVSGGNAFVAATQIQASQCGQTLPAINTTIMANAVTGASSYRFKVMLETGDNIFLEQYVTSPTRGFTLTQMANYAFGKQYHIRVAVLYQGVWQPYGADCTVITPTPLTKIQIGQCGGTIATMADVIYANAVSFAPGYRFMLTNAANPSETYVLDRSLREFRMNLIPGILYGATYNVEVAVKNIDGNYLPYGEICTVNTPVVMTKIQASQCGATLGAMADIIYADLVPNSTGYRFRVINSTNQSEVHTIDRNLREFRMNLMSGIQYNTNYLVQVAIRYGNGNYLQYGPVCTIRTPGFPIPKIQLSQCEMIASSANEMIYADPVPNAGAYRFRLQNNDIGYNHYVDNTLGYFRLNMFNGLPPGTTYTVKVAVKLNGVFTPYGKGCSVTTPGSAGKMEDIGEVKVNDEMFSATLYPNPFSENFTIDLSTTAQDKISVKVYDITGRLLETRNVGASELSAQKIGDQYHTGVYNVMISQGEHTRTFRMIKR